MEPVRECLRDLGKDSLEKDPWSASEFKRLVDKADQKSADTLRAVLSDGFVEARKFHLHYDPAVCLTECTLAGVLTHSSRFGRYGLVFPKDVVYRHGARPLAHVEQDVRDKYIEMATDDELIKENQLHVTILNPPQTGGTVQDYTHEREWRCPRDIPISEAVALIVAKIEDHEKFRPISNGMPILSLEFLYQLGL